MSATDGLESKILSLYFNNTGAANIGDATGLRGSTTAGNIFVALTTADPGDTATSQLTSESAYTNYARQSTNRASGAGGWTISGTTQAANASAVTFPACGATGSTITNFTLGSATSGAGNLDIIGTAALTVSNGVTPSFAAGACVVTLD
jgi:hypothetical protein